MQLVHDGKWKDIKKHPNSEQIHQKNANALEHKHWRIH